MTRTVVALVLLGAFFPALAADTITGTASVIDGDTIEIHGQRIRLHGIDAPESRQTCTRDGKPWRCGKDAAFALSDFIGDHTVSCSQTDTDRYKRIVAVCRIGSENINAWLVHSGWAMDWPKYSKGAFADDQKSAKASKLGVWGSEFEEPWVWRKNHR